MDLNFYENDYIIEYLYILFALLFDFVLLLDITEWDLFEFSAFFFTRIWDFYNNNYYTNFFTILWVFSFQLLLINNIEKPLVKSLSNVSFL